jgi:homoserine O-succinyltransferase/O-acetyltransferase
MPVLIDNLSPDHHLSAEVENNRAKIARETSGAWGRAINIGLINNMSDGALISTERQLFNLLNKAAGKLPVRLCLYSLPTVSRSDWGRQYIRRFYSDVEELGDGDLDGLIVTGAEPQTPTLSQEPYWRSLLQVIDWAQQNTASTVWSCLAVHGAVLYLDGIERTPLGQKCVGIFEQAKRDDHPLLKGVPSRMGIPHSRWNEVGEESLVANGYSILTCSEAAGVDMFVKQQKQSLFVYFQGHPEYDAHSLLGEYRRDVGRFLRRESESYPTIPHAYFDDRAVELLIAFQRGAQSDRRNDMLARFPVDIVGINLKNTWQSAANRIYHNWILYLSTGKSRRKVARRGNHETLKKSTVL